MSTLETETVDTHHGPAPALPEATANGRARRTAMTQEQAVERRPTSLVAYESAGRVVVIGPEEAALANAQRLKGKVSCTALITDAAETEHPGDNSPLEAKNEVRRIHARVASVYGHLGAFGVKALVNGEEVDLAPSLITAHKPFDVVLDLSPQRWIKSEVSPPGYFAPRNSEALKEALEAISEMVGSFEKPRYFAYDASICAHGNSGLEGCTRCLEACPTDAITSLKDLIEVDPYLCQGGGSCATACPTGAITYAYPKVADLLSSLKAMLVAYGEAGGGAPGVLFHDGGAGREWLELNSAELPENLIPFEVEEIGSVGMDAWLALIAYGAQRVVLVCPPGVPASVMAELEHQLHVVRAILAGMGLSRELVTLAHQDDAGAALGPAEEDVHKIEPAGFAAVDEKRTIIRMAVDHLFARAPRKIESTALPAGAPFGQVHVNQETCTLCMACVSVCPASALMAGGEVPRLDFIEWNCVQCGLCETACPEDAVSLTPRFLFDAETRRARRVLNEDKPFHCVSCGKAFATTRVIERMRDKLKGHWMFRKPEAVKRLEMCEECRVKDMLKDGGGLLDVHDRS